MRTNRTWVSGWRYLDEAQDDHGADEDELCHMRDYLDSNAILPGTARCGAIMASPSRARQARAKEG